MGTGAPSIFLRAGTSDVCWLAGTSPALVAPPGLRPETLPDPRLGWSSAGGRGAGSNERWEARPALRDRASERWSLVLSRSRLATRTWLRSSLRGRCPLSVIGNRSVEAASLRSVRVSTLLSTRSLLLGRRPPSVTRKRSGSVASLRSVRASTLLCWRSAGAFRSSSLSP